MAYFGINTVDLSRRNPKGCKESSRWSESAETTGKVVSHDRTPEGWQISKSLFLIRFRGSANDRAVRSRL